jgi:hypothetical protein
MSEEASIKCSHDGIVREGRARNKDVRTLGVSTRGLPNGPHHPGNQGDPHRTIKAPFQLSPFRRVKGPEFHTLVLLEVSPSNSPYPCLPITNQEGSPFLGDPVYQYRRLAGKYCSTLILACTLPPLWNPPELTTSHFFSLHSSRYADSVC